MGGTILVRRISPTGEENHEERWLRFVGSVMKGKRGGAWRRHPPRPRAGTRPQARRSGPSSGRLSLPEPVGPCFVDDAGRPLVAGGRALAQGHDSESNRLHSTATLAGGGGKGDRLYMQGVEGRNRRARVPAAASRRALTQRHRRRQRAMRYGLRQDFTATPSRAEAFPR